MAFKNEYIPPVENETSDFLKSAREILRTGYGSQDRWVVDRDRDMVLFRRGGGHSLESHDEDYWTFLDQSGRYLCDTTLLSKKEISEDEVAIVRSISFQSGGEIKKPDIYIVKIIKEALQEYKDWGVKSDYEHCSLTLINALTGEEI